MIKYKPQILSPELFASFVNKSKKIYENLPNDKKQLLGDFYGFGEPIFTKIEVGFRLKNSKGDSFYECIYRDKKEEVELLQTDVEWYDEFVKNIIEVYENIKKPRKMKKSFKAQIENLSVAELKEQIVIKQTRAKKAVKDAAKNTREAAILWEAFSQKNQKAYTTTEIAKELKTTAQLLNKFLEREKVIYQVTETFTTEQKIWKISGSYLHLVNEDKYVFDSASEKGLKRHITTIKWNEDGKYLITKLWQEKVASPAKAILMEA